MDLQSTLTTIVLVVEAIGAWWLIHYRYFNDSLLQRMSLWGVVFGSSAAAGSLVTLGDRTLGAVVGFLILDTSWALFCIATLVAAWTYGTKTHMKDTLSKE